MPLVSPTLVLLAAIAGTVVAVLVSAVIQAANRRAVGNAVGPAGFTAIATPLGLVEASTSHLPHVGAAAVRVRDVMALEKELLFRCDYTLGAVRVRRNESRVLIGQWDGQRLSSVRVAPADQGWASQYAALAKPSQTDG